MIDVKNATREELEAYILEQQTKKNKNTLLEQLQNNFNEYSDNSTDNFLWLHYLLSILYSNLELPINELLDKLNKEPEEDAIKKVIIGEVKKLVKTDDFKLRQRKTKVDNLVQIAEEIKEPNTPF